jgi:hypothetical protein
MIVTYGIYLQLFQHYAIATYQQISAQSIESHVITIGRIFFEFS